MKPSQSTPRAEARKPHFTYSEFLDLRPRLFIYGAEQDFSNGWVYHHWALLGHHAAPAIWGV